MAKVNEEKLLKEAIKEGKVILGTERVMKLLKKNKLKKIYLSANCPEKVVLDIQHHSKLAKVAVIKLNKTNDELGSFCKKPFSVSVLGVQ